MTFLCECGRTINQCSIGLAWPNQSFNDNRNCQHGRAMTNYKLYRFSIKPITLSRETMCLRKSASPNYICIILKSNYSPQPAKLFLPNFKANIIHIIIKKTRYFLIAPAFYGSDYASRHKYFSTTQCWKIFVSNQFTYTTVFYTQEYLYLRNTFSSIN